MSAVLLKLKGFLRAVVCVVPAFCVTASVCPAQRYSFSHVSSGLGNQNVDCIAQDRAGFLWVGTENGLYRYDGEEFVKFGTDHGLYGRTIQSLFVAPDGTLFAGTTDGIYFQRADGNFTQIQPPAPVRAFSQRVGSVFTALAPNLLVAADRSGAYLLRRTASRQWSAEAMHLQGGMIWSVLATPDGTLWYGCGNDLCRLQKGRTQRLGAQLHLPRDTWLHLLLARDGHIWIRGAVHLGEVIPGQMRYLAHDLPGRSDATPYDELMLDARGRILSAQGPVFGLWEDGHWHMVTQQNGLTRDDISSMFVDREGSIWIGLVGHGLMRWVGQDRWEAYTTADGLSDDIVWAALRDSLGRLWVGTESGLDFMPPGSHAAQLWRGGGIQTARAVTLAESGNGAVWMGSAAGSLVRIDEKSLSGRAWKIPEVYRALYDAPRHCLWVATDGGLYSVDTKAAVQAPRQVEIAALAKTKTRFTDLALDGEDRLWAASDAGLFRLDARNWQRIDPGTSGVNPQQIAVGAKNVLWASGSFPGIMRLRIESGRVVEALHLTRPPLLSDQVVSLLVDRRGWLWAGEDAGLTVFNGRIWRNLTQNDGLIWNDTDSYALSEDRDGSLWVGTSGGLAHLIHPDDLPSFIPLQPVISKINFGAASMANGARVPWSASPLTINIAALSFRDASHVRIRYRLLGLESDWVTTPTEQVRYPRLEPGRYRFQAQTVDVIEGRASSIAEIDFRITPRWWQSWELRAALLLLAAAGLALLWRWRTNLLMRQKRALELAVQSRTEDLEREKAELLRAREQMRHYAEHDDLTGLWNHRIIMERLRSEVDRSQRDLSPVSIILVDLDHFKAVNDNFGHPAGDRVLKEVAAIFLRSVRSYDWVGRYGGEEFLLILPGTDFESAKVRAEQLRQEVSAAMILEGAASIRITASFGVASGFPSSYETLIRSADRALYRAKGAGRNCVMLAEI